MAELEDTGVEPEMEEEVIEQEAPVEDDTPEAVKELARELGWKEDYEGENKKDPRTFILDSRDIQRGLSDQVRSLREQTERMGRVAEELSQAKAAERDAYWQQQLNQAVELGDTEAVKQLVETRPVAEPVNNAAPPEVQTWMANNPWFEKDAAARAVAQAASNQYSHLPVAEQLKLAEREVRVRFPEYFRQAAKPAPSVATTTSRSATVSNRKKGFADLPADTQRMARDMVDRNPSLTLDMVAASYWNDIAKNGRKV